ncbi:MAG TPA: hypothetical protein VIL26_08190 [Clostridia bacterium]
MDQSNPSQKILFVCTGNTCRSPMAEVIFKTLAKNQSLNFKASSAGLYAQKEQISPNAKEALKQLGYIPPKSRLSKQLNQNILNTAGIVFTMTDRQKAQLQPYFKNVYSMSEVLGYEINDPYGGSLDDYIKCAKDLENAIKIIIHELSK